MRPYFHTTLYANMPDIAASGLVPRQGSGLFQHGSYGHHSQGKVFAAEADAAFEWFGKVEDQAQHYYVDDEEPDRLVPVMLRLNLDGYEVHKDEVGSQDVWGGDSVYVTERVPPDRIEFWCPAHDAWMEVAEFDATDSAHDVYQGVSEIEHYDAEGDVVEEHEGWESRGFTVRGAYDDGGFKPDHEDENVWELGWPGGVERLPTQPTVWDYLTPEQAARLRAGGVWQVDWEEEPEEAIFVRVPVEALTVGLPAWMGALRNVRAGKRSHSKGRPLEVLYDPDTDSFLLTDGHHRLAESVVWDDQREADIVIWHGGWQDYYSVPAPDDRVWGSGTVERLRAERHAMKVGPWAHRLEAGTQALERALATGDRAEIIAGLDDVSFWIGRLMGDTIAAGQALAADVAGLPERVQAAITQGYKASQAARAALGDVEHLPVSGAPGDPRGRTVRLLDYIGAGRAKEGVAAWVNSQGAALAILQRGPHSLDIGYGNPQALGCGNFGCAYELPDYPGWVLKITSDPTDAAAWATVGPLGIQGLARVPLVFAFPDTIPGPRLYGIVMERLRETKWSEYHSPARFLDLVGDGAPSRIVRDDWAVRGGLLPEPEGWDNPKDDRLRQRRYSRYLQIAADEGVSDEAIALLNTLAELGRHGIWTEDIRGANVLVDSAGAWRITDLGMSYGPQGVEIPELGVDLSPEQLRTLGLDPETLHWTRTARALEVQQQATEDDALLAALMEPLPTGPVVVRPAGWGTTDRDAAKGLTRSTVPLNRYGHPDPGGWNDSPGYLYRGMTEAEYAATVGAGLGVRSRQDYSGRGEGTSLAADFETAESYVNSGRDDPRVTGRPTYMVEVRVEYAPRADYFTFPAPVVQTPDGYYKAEHGIPPERVARVWRMEARDGAVVAVQL